MKTTNTTSVVSLRTNRKNRKSTLRRGVLAASISALVGLAAPLASRAAVFTYDDGGGTLNWSDAVNWNPNGAPVNGSDLVFSVHTAGAGTRTASNDSLTNVQSITFGGQTFLLNGNAITLGAGGITNNSATTQTISFGGTGITLGASQTWNAAAGALNVTSAVNAGGNNFIIDGAQGTTLGGVLSGSNTLTKNGAGNLTLSAANTFSGLYQVNAGTLTLNNSNANVSTVFVNNASSLVIGAAGSVTTSVASGVTVQGTSTISAAAATSTITGNLNYSSSSASTFQGVIAGAASTVTTSGTALLTLSGNNSYGGATVLNNTAGNGIVVSSNTALGAGNGTAATGTTVNTGAALYLTSGVNVANEALILNGTGNGNGALVNLNGATTVTWGGPITVGASGAATIGSFSGGTVNLGGQVNIANSTLTLHDGQAGAGGQSIINVNGAIVGASGNLTVNGVRANLGAANTYVGTTTITSNNVGGGNGIINATVAGALPAPVADGGTGTARSALSMDQSGTGSSRLNLVGFNQAVASLTGAASSTINLNANTLTVGTAGGTTTFAGVISGTGNLIKDGTSTQILSGNNTYGGGAGTTTILNGTLQVGINNALPVGTAVTVGDATTLASSSARLNLAGFNQAIASLTIVAPSGGSGNVDLNGGTLTVNGNISLVDTASAPGNGLSGNINSNGNAASRLDLGGAVRNFNVASQNIGTNSFGGDDLRVSAVIQNGGVTVNGTNSATIGTVGGARFTAVNTYGLVTTVNSGTLRVTAGTVAGNSALGFGDNTAGTGTVVNAGGSLVLGNGVTITTEALTLNGVGAARTGGAGIGALVVDQGGTATWGGSIIIGTTNTVITAGNGSTLNLTGGVVKNGVNVIFGNIAPGATVANSGVINISGVGISGTSGVGSFNSDVLYTTGTVNLAVASPYLGATWMNNGAVVNANVAGALPSLIADGGIAATRTALIMDADGSAFFGAGNFPTSPAGATNSTGGSILNLGANQAVQFVASGPTTSAATRINLNNFTLTIGTSAGTPGFVSPATFAGVITGTNPGFAVIKDGTSTQVLTGINTYIGFTAVNGGTLQVGDGATPFSQLGTGLVFVNPTGTLDIRLANGGIFANTVNTAGVSTVVGTNTAGNTQRITGAINGTANFLQNAGGTSVFENVNTYQGGTRITNASTIIIGTLTAGATAGQNISTNTVVVDTGSTLNLVNVSGGVLNNNITNGNGGAGLVTSTSTFATTLTGSLTDGAAGTIALTQNGSGTTTLVNAGNTYTGATTVLQGTLQVGTAGLVGSVGSQAPATGIVVGTGGTLTIVNTTGNALANNVTNGVGGAGTLIVNSANNNTLSGTLTDGGAGTLALTQSGTGTTILTNAGNTYTGATTISGGTLQLGTVPLVGTIGAANVNLGTGGTLAVVNVGPTPAAVLNNIQNNLGGTGLVNNSSTAGVSFFGNILDGVGSIAFTQSGTGASFLTGANTYSGVTNVTAGTLFAGSATALGTAANGTVVAAGATLDLNNQTIAAEAVQIQGTGDAAGLGFGIPQIGALSNSGINVATLGGPVTLAASASIGSASGLGGIVLTNSVIGGAAATLTKVGTDTLTLNGVNIYSGATLINAGIVIAGNASALGNIGAGTTVANGAALSIANGIFVIAEPLTINGAGAGPAAPGALTQALGGTSSFAGPITVATNSTINSNGGTLTLTGPINKTGVNLTLAGIGGAGSAINVNGVISGNTGALNSDLIVNGTTANLNAANTYLGQTFITSIVAGDGIVNANVASALPTSPVRTQLIMDAAAAGNAAAAAGAGASVLNVNTSQSVASLTSAAGTGSVVNLGANTLTIGFGTANVNVGYVNSTFNGVINGTGGITKDEASVQILAGQSTYTGATLVSGGTLRAGVNDAGGQGATTNGAFGNSSAVTVNTPGILEIGGFNVGIGSLAGTGTVQDSSGGTGTLTTGGNNTSTNFSGVLQDQAAGGALGGLQLWKVGTGTQTLSGAAANTYSGVTFVRAGELDLNKTAGVDALGNGTGIVFIGDGVGAANSDIVKLLANEQLNNNTVVAIDGTTGKFDLNNFNETILVLTDALAPIAVNGSSVALGSGTLTFGDGTNNTFSGAITGTGNIIKNGTGIQTLAGTTTANTFSGTTTVNAGELDLNKTAGTQAIGGHMTIGDGLGGANSDIVKLLQSNQIIDTSRISIDGSSGRLDINGQTETIAWFADTGVVAVNGSSVDLGAGGSLTYGNASNQTFSGAITGTGNIIKNGTGTQTLAGTVTANTFSGLTTVNSGQIDLNKTAGTLAIGGNLTIGDGAGPGVVPTANSDIVRLLQSNQIADTSVVLINGTTGQLNLNGNSEIIAGFADTGTVTVNGSSVALGAGTLTFGADNVSRTFSGAITGAGGNLIKNGTGTQTLAGTTTANTYSGLTTVNAGRLDLNKTAGTTAIGGNLTIGDGAGGANSDIVRLLQSNQIIDSSVVQLNATSGRLDLNNLNETVGSIASTGAFTLGGSTITLGTGALTTGGNNGTTAYSGVISGTGTLTKEGTGTFTLSGANTYSGPTTVNNGTLSLSGGAALADTSAVTVNALGTLNLVNSETIASLAGSGAVTLNARTLTTGVDNSSTTHSGVISGAGGALVKEGTGFFTVSGANTYTGGTTVNNGTLGAANGSAFGNGNLTMNGGTIQTVGGPLIVNIGTGNIQFNGGTYIANVGGTTPGVQHDQLLTTGSAAFPGGTLALVQNNGYLLQPGDKVNLAIATGGVAGGTAIGAALPAAAVTGLAAFSNTPLLVPTVNLYTTSVTLEAMQGSFAGLNGQTFGGTRIGYTVNQFNVARALDSVAKTINNKTGIFKEFNFLDTQSLSTLQSNLDKIAPEELTAIFSQSIALANLQTANIQRRTEDIRNQATVPSAAAYAAAGSGTQYSGGMNGPVGRRSKEIAPPSEDRWGMFLNGSGQWSRVGSQTNAAGYRMESGGLTAGIDYRVNTNFAIGLDLGYVGTTASLANGGSLETDGGRLGLYATYFQDNFYLDMAVNGGLNSHETRRTTPSNTAATGRPDGSEINVLVATGYDWKMGGLTVGPVASFQYTNVQMDGFTETGAFAPLAVNGQNVESIRTSLGLRAFYDAHVGRVIVRPEVKATWQHEYGDSLIGITSRFATLGGSPFTVFGPTVGRDSLLLSAGFSILWNDRMSTYVYYDGEVGRSNYDSHSISGGFRMQF